jgi:hypothetical protein
MITVQSRTGVGADETFALGLVSPTLPEGFPVWQIGRQVVRKYIELIEMIGTRAGCN